MNEILIEHLQTEHRSNGSSSSSSSSSSDLLQYRQQDRLGKNTARHNLEYMDKV